jgi:hypothetical protein
LVTVSFANAQSTKNTQPNSKTDTAAKAVYTCPMHPEVISDKPGKCPKCGMDLVKKKPVKDSTMKGMKMDSTKH